MRKSFGRWNLFLTILILITILALLFEPVAAAKDFYEILGVSRSASLKEIKKAYRKLSKSNHPDVNPSEDATNQFASIARSYEVLSDPKKKKAFDRGGMKALEDLERDMSVGSDGSSDPFSSMFGGFFGGGGRRRRGKSRTPDSRFVIPVTLKQLYDGDVIFVSFNRTVVCSRADECVITNSDCVGTGVAMQVQSYGNMIVQQQIRDSSCVDQGKSWTKKGCKACPKGPQETDTISTSILIEPGMKSGDEIRHEGIGEHLFGSDPGDLVFVIKEQLENSKFVRDQNDNLLMTYHITLTEALLGFSVLIPHPSGQPVPLSKNGVTMDGEVVVIAKQGMPKKGKQIHGDLFVKIKIRYPDVEFTSLQREGIANAFKDIRTWKHVPVQN